jgi:pimeloyl-ACP methyl ester carboxylesterase
MESRIVTSFDGIALTVDVDGPPDGPAVVLVHGFLADADRNWHRPQITATLVAAGHRVIAYDQRGHGRSERPAVVERYEHDALARDLVAVIDAVGDNVGEVDVVGYSLGAIVVSRALVVGLRPRSVVLGGMGDGLLDPMWSKPAAIAEAFSKLSIERTEPVVFGPGLSVQVDELEAFAALQRAHRGVTAEEFALLPVTPTLVLCGRDDRDNGDASILAAAIPNAELHWVDGNHLDAITRPSFRLALIDWLRRNPPDVIQP